MRIIRREIRVGNRVFVGAVCSVCPTTPVIWPIEALKEHLESHAHPPIEPEYGHHPVHHRGGRPSGVRNVHSMSATGEEKRGASIRLIARPRGA